MTNYGENVFINWLIDFELILNHVAVATVWTGVDGFGEAKKIYNQIGRSDNQYADGY